MSDLTIALGELGLTSPTTANRPEFAKLLRHAGQPETGWDPACEVTLGDVALACGAPEAWRMVRRLDWTSSTVRHAVVRALLPALQRAKGPARVLEALGRWANGGPAAETVDLHKVFEDARTAIWGTQAASRAEDAALATAWTIVAAAGPGRSWQTLASVPMTASLIATAAAQATAAVRQTPRTEHKRQVADLVAAFPPLHGPLAPDYGELPKAIPLSA
jgi:hypothetical protein